MSPRDPNIAMAKRTRRVHFVGIGGSGMSAIAEVLVSLGYAVRGSDLHASSTTERLIGIGADVRYGHLAENVDAVDVVVTSSAVSSDNPEVLRARQLGIPVIARAEMLAELMRLKFAIAVGGTHGKTTTTSMISHVLYVAGLEPTIIVGGRLNFLGSNARLGEGPYLVAEADESDGSFLQLTPTLAVVTNIDREHLDHYQSGMSELEAAFLSFLNRVPFYGLGVVCLDDPGVRRIVSGIKRRWVSYSTTRDADYVAENIRAEGLTVTFDLRKANQLIGPVRLQMAGRHNAMNALAALAVADEIGVPLTRAIQALGSFAGVDRRFTMIGTAKDIIVVDDYGHHPTEIRVTLQAARDAFPSRRLVVAFQPHRYSRTLALHQEFGSAFAAADVLFLAPIYAASEVPIPGVDASWLAEGIRENGLGNVHVSGSLDELREDMLSAVKPGDVVVVLGAGSIGQLGARLLADLNKAATP
jgi:UDP-N-acetylmuramate--alanine ligase